MVRNRQSQDLYRTARKRMIRETEEFLIQALRQPQKFVRIPAVEVGRGRFDPRFASVFWSQALGVAFDPPSRQASIIAQRFNRPTDFAS
ncbi:MAG: hypothetical protein ACE5GE_11535 [Phycisphaerae bacterium]